MIGTDPVEWAEGHDEAMRLMRASDGEGGPGATFHFDEVRGFSEGTVGWAAARGSFGTDEARIAVRLTLVAHREGDGWKTVQSHASIGVPSDHMLDPMFQA